MLSLVFSFHLLCHLLLGSPPLVRHGPFLATHAKLSHGCLKQVKIHLKNPIQGSQSAVEFLQHVKSHIDEPAIPRVPMEEEELTKKNLDDLNDEYIELI